MTFHIVLRLRLDARIVGYYAEHDPRCRWTTDPKRRFEFSDGGHAETVAEDLRRSETNRAYSIHVEPT